MHFTHLPPEAMGGHPESPGAAAQLCPGATPAGGKPTPTVSLLCYFLHVEMFTVTARLNDYNMDGDITSWWLSKTICSNNTRLTKLEEKQSNAKEQVEGSSGSSHYA